MFGEDIYIYLCHRCSGNIKFFGVFFSNRQCSESIVLYTVRYVVRQGQRNHPNGKMRCVLSLRHPELEVQKKRNMVCALFFNHRHLRVLAKVRWQTKCSNNPTLCINESIFLCVLYVIQIQAISQPWSLPSFCIQVPT